MFRNLNNKTASKQKPHSHLVHLIILIQSFNIQLQLFVGITPTAHSLLKLVDWIGCLVSLEEREPGWWTCCIVSLMIPQKLWTWCKKSTSRSSSHCWKNLEEIPRFWIFCASCVLALGLLLDPLKITLQTSCFQGKICCCIQRLSIKLQGKNLVKSIFRIHSLYNKRHIYCKKLSKYNNKYVSALGQTYSLAMLTIQHCTPNGTLKLLLITLSKCLVWHPILELAGETRKGKYFVDWEIKK